MANSRSLRAEAQQLVVLVKKVDDTEAMTKIIELAMELKRRANLLDANGSNGSAKR